MAKIKENKIIECNRKSAYINIYRLCTFARENDYLEMTEWANGEGYDIKFVLLGKENKIALTIGQLDALTLLFDKLYKNN
jgi:hypothetical protein